MSRNYAGEKWTKKDIDRVSSIVGRDMTSIARRDNKELDRKTKLTRDESRYKEPISKQKAQNMHPRQNHESLSGREWENHKYIDKVRTKTGKIRYIYELPNGSRLSYEEGSPHNNAALTGNNSNRWRAVNQEFSENMGTHGKHLANNLRKGRFNNAVQDVKNMADEIGSYSPSDAISMLSTAANDAYENVSKQVDSVVKSASKAVSDGASYVSKMMSDVVANTPLKDLFK